MWINARTALIISASLFLGIVLIAAQRFTSNRIPAPGLAATPGKANLAPAVEVSTQATPSATHPIPSDVLEKIRLADRVRLQHMVPIEKDSNPPAGGAIDSIAHAYGRGNAAELTPGNSAAILASISEARSTDQMITPSAVIRFADDRHRTDLMVDSLGVFRIAVDGVAYGTFCVKDPQPVLSVIQQNLR